MVQPSRFTIAGVLYEGSDYQEWRARVDAVLRLHFGDVAYEQIVYDFQEDYVKVDAVAKVRAFISDELLKRVPDKIKVEPFALLKHVEKLVKPFRLMDLPPELRIRIFEKFWEGGEYFDIYWRYPRRGRRASRYPALLHSSSLVRRETLPIFYSMMRFDIKISDHSGDQASAPYVMELLEQWANTIAAGQVRNLRSMMLKLEYYDCGYPIYLEFSEVKGLSLNSRNLIAPAEFLQELNEVVNATEVHRQALDHRGEALITALTSKPELWRHESLMED